MYPNLIDIKGVGQKRLQTITKIMSQNNWTLSDVYTMSAESIKKTFSLPINIAKAIASAGQNISEEISDQSTPDAKIIIRENVNKEILVISINDENYPSKLIEKLGSHAPEELHIWGNLDLLTMPSVGFCGSRNVSQKGLEITADVAAQIAELGWVVVSGHARGVDAVAHKTALENNAGTIIVLPQGFDDFKLRSELRSVAKYDNLLVISEFPIEAGWAVGRAMQRNKTIIGLSDVMVLVESRTNGGTFSAGKTALKYKQPLFVVTFDDASKSNSNAGNDYFIQKGAIRLMKSRTTSRANISTLREKVTNRQPQLSPPEQLTMPLNTE